MRNNSIPGMVARTCLGPLCQWQAGSRTGGGTGWGLVEWGRGQPSGKNQLSTLPRTCDSNTPEQLPASPSFSKPTVSQTDVLAKLLFSSSFFSGATHVHYFNFHLGSKLPLLKSTSQILNGIGLSVVQEFVFLASSQVMLTLLVQGPHFKNHWPKEMKNMMNKGKKA